MEQELAVNKEGSGRRSVAHLLFCYLKEKCFVVAGFPEEGQSSVALQ